MEAIRVALIEDHDLTRMGLKTALQKHGLDFLGEAATGAKGLQLVADTHPDVAIVDIGLPDMDGIELTRQIQVAQANQDQPTRILILTMHDSEDSVLAAFSAGAHSYCTKELATADLMTAVVETAQGHSWIDPAIANIVLREVRNTHAAEAVNQDATVEIDAIAPEHKQLIETYPLTERELEILELIAAGGSNAEIAAKLYITIGTVKTHVRSILNKLCVNDRTQAAVRALRSGLIR